jgi:hypothetical protein
VLISAEIHNNVGNTIGRIIENEWVFDPGEIWDFEAFHRHAKIRERLGVIAFDVDTRNDVVSINGIWYFEGRKIESSERGLFVGGSGTIGCTVMNCRSLVRVV